MIYWAESLVLPLFIRTGASVVHQRLVLCCSWCCRFSLAPDASIVRWRLLLLLFFSSWWYLVLLLFINSSCCCFLQACSNLDYTQGGHHLHPPQSQQPDPGQRYRSPQAARGGRAEGKQQEWATAVILKIAQQFRSQQQWQQQLQVY